MLRQVPRVFRPFLNTGLGHGIMTSFELHGYVSGTRCAAGTSAWTHVKSLLRTFTITSPGRHLKITWAVTGSSLFCKSRTPFCIAVHCKVFQQRWFLFHTDPSTSFLRISPTDFPLSKIHRFSRQSAPWQNLTDLQLRTGAFTRGNFQTAKKSYTGTITANQEPCSPTQVGVVF